jgi:hypothetical protein
MHPQTVGKNLATSEETAFFSLPKYSFRGSTFALTLCLLSCLLKAGVGYLSAAQAETMTPFTRCEVPAPLSVAARNKSQNHIISIFSNSEPNKTFHEN